MASLDITVGPVTGSVTASNAKAQNVLNDVAALFGITGTDQEKLDAIAQLVADWLVEKSIQYRKPAVLATAEAGVEDDADHQWEQ